MNLFIGIGRLTKDPDIRRTNEGLTIARYTLAIDRIGKDKDADFISCVAFGKVGEFAEKYLRKGTKIAIEGRIQTGNYTNKDGNKVYTTDVIVSSHEFCEMKSDGGAESAPAGVSDFMSVPDDIDEDIPFK